MQLTGLETIAPALAARLAGAKPHLARRFALRAARLACAVAGVRDRVAIELSEGGLEHHTDVDELVRLWELERELDSPCHEQLAGQTPTPETTGARFHEECAGAHAVSAVIAALRPDPLVAAREAAYEAWAAGCEDAAIEAFAEQLL